MRPRHSSLSDSPDPAHAQLNGSSNGVSSAPKLQNGVHANGNGVSKASRSEPAFENLMTEFGHDKMQLTKLMLQALSGLGYHSAASALEAESGIDLEGPSVARFRDAVLQGRWSDVERLLLGSAPDASSSHELLVLTPAEGSARSSRESLSLGGLVQAHNRGLVSSSIQRRIKFYIRRQKYLELLEARDLITALRVLQMEIQPTGAEMSEVNRLSSFLMCPNASDVRLKADWSGVEGGSRLRLLEELSLYVPPAVMMPPNRLEALLRQVKDHWIDECLYHTSTTEPSLYENHECSENDFPTFLTCTLADHKDDVLCLQYSRDGQRLATGGMDGTVKIYDTIAYGLVSTLDDGHPNGIHYLAWSPNRSRLLVCTRGAENTVKMFDALASRHLFTLGHYTYEVTAVAWANSGTSFVTGSMELKTALQTHDANGAMLYDWGLNFRVHDLAITPDDSKLVVATKTRIYVFDFNTQHNLFEVSTDDMTSTVLTSLDISSDSRYLLVGLKPDQMKIIDLETSDPKESFHGALQRDFVVRSCFGGEKSAFVASGSEDSAVYIWRRNGQLITKLLGHNNGCVNSVAWHPRNTRQLASAGDDHTVRIWSALSVERPDSWITR